MSATNCACPCPDPTVTEIPGAPGEDGAAGADGANGVNIYTLLTADAIFADAVATVQVSVAINTAYVVGQTVFAADPSPGTDHGTFEVISLTGTTVIGLRATDAPGDTALPYTIGSGGKLTATGATGALAGALPTALADNSTGTASNTIAAGVGVTTLAFFINAATIANGDLLTEYVPGYAFKILKFDARCAAPVTTGAKAATLNLEIQSTNLTGGAIALAGTYAIGAAQAGSAVTAANTGSATDSFSIEASSVTAFTEGSFWLLISIQNMDTANAVASLADHVNDLITALT